MQHLRDMAHDDLGILAFGWLHAWLYNAGHTPTSSVRRVVRVHDASPINGDQDRIRKGSLFVIIREGVFGMVKARVQR